MSITTKNWNRAARALYKLQVTQLFFDLHSFTSLLSAFSSDLIAYCNGQSNWLSINRTSIISSSNFQGLKDYAQNF